MSKITALTALTSPQADDLVPVVDVHDTTQASSGTTKKITVGNLLSAGSPLAPDPVPGVTSLLVPLYEYPTGGGLTDWNTLNATAPPVRYVIANPASGPGSTPDANWTAAIKKARAAGVTVLGYVDTNYNAVATGTVAANIGLWKSLYGVTSIFFDRVSSLSSDLAYYTTACASVTGVTVLNHGAIPDPGYAGIGDVLVVFENQYSAWGAFTPASWMYSYPPSKFCALVWNCTSGNMPTVMGQAQGFGIGNCLLTDEADDNFTALPSYLAAEASLAQKVGAGPPGGAEPSGAIVYVAPNGSDASSGLTWTAAKATIGAAIAALPSSGGTVEIGAGTWTFTTSARTDASVTYNTSGAHAGTWTDASATSADVGSYIIGANINGRAPKITVVSGGYITTDIAPGGTVSAQSITIVKPGIVLPDGVTLQGQGSTTNTAAPKTLLIDSTGTGIVVFARGGNNFGDYFGRSRIRDLAIWGSSGGNTYGTTLAGLWVNNNDSFFELTNCDISGHGTCAVGLDYNVNSLDARNTLFGYNGTAGSSTATGGVLIDPFCAFASASVCFYDCWWVNNYGFGIIGVASGANTPVSLYSCQFNETLATSVYLSGTAVVSNGGQPTLLMNCWIETSATYDVVSNYGNLVIVGSVLYSAIGYAIYSNNAAATVTLIGTLSQNHTTATINNNGANVSWFGCSIQDSVFIAGVATPANAAAVGTTGPPNFSGQATFSGLGTTPTGHWNGSIITDDLTVLPNSGISTSASLFLDNNAGQVFEFFNSSGGSFGIYDKTNSKQPLTVDANTANSLLHLFGTTVQVNGGGDLDVATAGHGLKVAEGSNAKQGTATLSSGTVAVSNTSVTANSRIFLTAQDNNSTGVLRVSARTAGTSFTITSSNGTDSGVVAYEIFEPG